MTELVAAVNKDDETPTMIRAAMAHLSFPGITG
jgi:hypothetical protein